MNKWASRAGTACAVLGLGALLGGCGSTGGAPPPVPFIQNINNSTSPSSPVSLPIEINGTGFQQAPGKVVFTQGSVTATIVPNAGGWSTTGIIATVPTGNGSTNFTVPGTVNVTVVTSGGTSNAIQLSLIQTLTFNVNNVAWAGTDTALPTALTGLRAVGVPVSATSAFVVVTGGFDGTNDTTTVLSNTLNPDGTVGASWIAITANPLPSPRAHHGMAIAYAGNSLVPVNSAFAYVVGGQQNATDTPGGTNTVFMAPVNLTTGAVGPWTQLANNLPQALVGPAVTLFNGYLYVVGGLTTGGTPSAAVYSAQIQPDGTIGPWTTSANPYPVPVSFATAFGFAGNLYVLDGDSQNSTDPNSEGANSDASAPVPGINNVNFASAHNGKVGAWASTNSTIKMRKKQIAWVAFGQVIDAEGVYEGSPGSLELERTQVNPDGTLAAWNGITSTVNQINANVYNAAALVSPLQSPTATPRFLLLGGQAFVTTSPSPPGPLSSTVYVNLTP